VKNWALIATVLLAGCGSSERLATVTAPLVKPAPACAQPSGQEKAALRFAVRGHDVSNDAGPAWARVRSHGVNYMAAVLVVRDAPRLVALVAFPQSGRYLAGMRAVNGSARTFTDLPNAGASIPAAGTRALACVG
jgi:hypothetical protein